MFFEALAPTVAGYLRAHGASEPDDLTSEVFLGVFRNIADFEGDEDGFRSWVFTIAHRRLIDERRRRGRRPSTVPLEAVRHDVVGAPDPEELALAWEGDEQVLRLVSKLSPAQRDVILLRVVAGLSAEQVGNILGKRPGAIRVLQHRALTNLRKLFPADV